MAVDVITHKSVQLDQLTHAQLRRIYSMRQTVWVDGSVIQVFVLPKDHPIHQEFAKETLQIFPYQLDAIWNKLTYSGVGNRPIVVQTQEELVERVATTPAAIGYIEQSDGVQNVNIIHINK